jgi:phospholipid/cholesterol/gamma-HCH transport system permease protein
LNFDMPPGLVIETGTPGPLVRLSGQWTALALARDRARAGATTRLAALAGEREARWDLSAVERMDHVGGQALWRVWGRKLPEAVALTDMQRDIFARIALLEAQRE